MAIRKSPDGAFAARKEVFEKNWRVSFESGDVQKLPRVTQVLEEVKVDGIDRAVGQKAKVAGVEYVVRGLGGN